MPGAHGASFFPDLALPDLGGTPRPLAEAWAAGEALFLLGHCDCKTTRDGLPYLDRIHRRRKAGHAVRVVLQDDGESAARLVAQQGLEVPVLLEADPYPLARVLELVAVPTLYLVGSEGRILGVSEGFRRADLEAFAARLGSGGPLFVPGDEAPEFRPG